MTGGGIKSPGNRIAWVVLEGESGLPQWETVVSDRQKALEALEAMGRRADLDVAAVMLVRDAEDMVEWTLKKAAGMPTSKLLLACGEMTAGEIRTVRAVLGWVAHAAKSEVLGAEQKGEPAGTVSTTDEACASNRERERFERYFVDSRRSRGAKKRTDMSRLDDGTYADDHVQRHWWTWQQAIGSEGV